MSKDIKTNVPFPTVLVARKQNENPSELEIVLRQWTNRLRVVNHLSGKSHLLLPGKETIAVRAYFPPHILELEEKYHKSYLHLSNETKEEMNQSYMHQLQWGEKRDKNDHKNINDNGTSSSVPESQKTTNGNSKHNNDKNHSNENVMQLDDDGDDLIAFRDSFKYPIVFFVLPPGEMQIDQLSRVDSFVMRAQRSLLRHSKQKNKKLNANGNGNGNGNVSKTQTTAKVFIVPDISSILHTLSSIMETVQPEKMLLKQQFLERCMAKQGILPNDDKNNQTEQLYAYHVSDAFRNFALKRLDLDSNDVNVLVSVLGNVGDIIQSASSLISMDSHPPTLEHIPITESSKHILKQFFASEREMNEYINETNGRCLPQAPPPTQHNHHENSYKHSNQCIVPYSDQTNIMAQQHQHQQNNQHRYYAQQHNQQQYSQHNHHHALTRSTSMSYVKGESNGMGTQFAISTITTTATPYMNHNNYPEATPLSYTYASHVQQGLHQYQHQQQQQHPHQYQQRTQNVSSYQGLLYDNNHTYNNSSTVGGNRSTHIYPNDPTESQNDSGYSTFTTPHPTYGNPNPSHLDTRTNRQSHHHLPEYNPKKFRRDRHRYGTNPREHNSNQFRSSFHYS